MHAFVRVLILAVGGAVYLVCMVAMLWDVACCRRNIREMAEVRAKREAVSPQR